MAVVQGAVGGFMPGMTLRAWALVTAAGVLVKSFGVASVAKTGTGTYTLTLSAALASSNVVVKGTAAFGGTFVSGDSAAGTSVPYRNMTSAGALIDGSALVEVWE